MATSTKRQDYLGRWLNNANPGTTNPATDFLTRTCTGTTDFAGRLLIFDNPSAWGTGTSYAAGDYVKPKTGTNYDAVYVALDAGTSHGVTEPTWPTTVGATVVDNPGASSVTWQCVHG